MTTNQFTLYDIYKERMDGLADAGFPSVAEVTKHFHKAADMDRALGLLNATSHWLSGRGKPGLPSEALAKAWLKNGGKAPDHEKAADTPKSGATLYLVTCQPGTADKVARVMAMLGCDMVEV